MNKLLKKYNSMPLVAKVTLWFMFCGIVQKCMSLITVPIFTRMMSTEQYGQFSVYNSWLQIFTIITTLRLNWGVFNKGMSKYKDDRDGYTSTMQTLTCIITTIVFIIYLIFRKQINELIELPTYVMIAMFAELYFTPAIDFWTVRKRYEYIYKPIVIRTLLMLLLNNGIGICAVYFSQDKGIARIMTCICVNIAFGSTLFVYNLKKGKKLLDMNYVKFALAFNAPLLLHYLSQYVLDQFDRVMIQKMVGMEKVAIYSVAYNIGLLMKLITTNINNALVPWEYDQLEKENIKKLDDTLFVICTFISVCAILFSCFAPELIRILADKKYYEAVYVVPPVAISMIFTFMYTTFANFEIYYGFNKFMMYISMAGAILNIGLNYVCIKLFGYIAAAYTTLFCYVVFTTAHYIYATYCTKKLLNVKKMLKTGRLLVLSAMTLICGLVVIFVYNYMVIRYCIIVSICIGMFLKRNQIITLFKEAKGIKKK